MGIVLNVLRNLVFLVNFDSVELNNETSIEIIFRLKCHLRLLINDFV